MKYLFIKAFIKLHATGFTQDIFITHQSPQKSLLFFSTPPLPLQIVCKRIRLSVFIAISLIFSSTVTCTQGAAALIITGFIVQLSLYHPKGTVTVLQTILLLYSVPDSNIIHLWRKAPGTSRNTWKKKPGHRQSTQARERQSESTFISVLVCASYLLSNFNPSLKPLLEPFLGHQPTYRLNPRSKLS